MSARRENSYYCKGVYSLSVEYNLFECDKMHCNYRRTETARSGCAWTADRRAPQSAACSACEGSVAAARGQVGRLRPSSARARGA